MGSEAISPNPLSGAYGYDRKRTLKEEKGKGRKEGPEEGRKQIINWIISKEIDKEGDLDPRGYSRVFFLEHREANEESLCSEASKRRCHLRCLHPLQAEEVKNI